LQRAAHDAGFERVDVAEQTVDSGLRTAQELVQYRFGMAMYAPFVAGLTPDARAGVYEAAIAAVGPDPPKFTTALLVLVARR
jgi:hypothetical protein